MDNLENDEKSVPVKEGENIKVGEKIPETAGKERKRSKLNAILIFIVGFLAGNIALCILLITGFLVVDKITDHNLSTLLKASGVLDEDVITKEIIIENMIKTGYYEDVDDEELKDGIFKGLLLGLGDPYSCYFTPEEIAEMNQEMSGNYEGIGAYLRQDTETGYVVIESFITGGSAEEAGILPGDVIVAVDGEDVYGLSLNEVVSKVKGPEGTTVTITVENASGKNDLVVERKKIDAPSVKVTDEGDGIYNITITEFAQNTSQQFKEALEEVRSKGATSLIIDLRGNPGGVLDSVVETCSQILPAGDIVYTEDKYGKQVHYESEGRTPLELPLVVLVDGASASAAEIMAGAIKDYGIGTLVGTTTYGKGVVQSVIPLNDGSAVKITTSRYFTPNGINIHHTGITPDEEVPFDAKKYIDEQIDNQLEYAKEKLKNK